MNETLIGLIGAGGRGALAHYAHQPDTGVRVVACADPDPRARTAFQQTYGPAAMVTADYRALVALPELAAVFVCTPDSCHEEHAVAALEAGKAVYLEKPMAITIEGCDHILEVARRTRQKIYVGHNMRHFGVVRKMKELIDAGAIGAPKTAWCRHFVSYGGDAYFKDWHADRSWSTGLLLQKGAHDLDVLHWLCGSYSELVTAMGGVTLYDQIADRHPSGQRGDPSFRKEHWPPLAQKQLNPILNVEDVSLVLMRLANGVFASYQQCHYTPDAWRNYTVVGTAGRLENFGDTAGQATVKVWRTRSDAYAPPDEEYPIPAENGTHGGADPKIVAEFVRFVREGGPTETSPVAARYSVAAGFMATQSLRNGSRPMIVPPLPHDLARYFPP